MTTPDNEASPDQGVGSEATAAEADSGAGERAPREPSFEEHLAELQRIVASLERGELGLDESLARFEQGVGLLRRCQQLLSGAEQRIELLTGFTAAGEPVTRSFDAAATFSDAPVSQEPAESVAKPKRERARRASRPNSGTPSTDEASPEPPRLF